MFEDLENIPNLNVKFFYYIFFKNYKFYKKLNIR